MKRWIILAVAVIIFVLSMILYIPNLVQSSGGSIVAFAFLMVGFVLLFVAISYVMSEQARHKIATLQNRLSMWTKLSYHVSQVGDEIFNELPIGIIACDEDFEIKWANPHAQYIFSNRVTGRRLQDVNEKMFEATEKAVATFMVQIDQKYYDVTYRPSLKFFYLFEVTSRVELKAKYHQQIPALGIIYLDNLEASLSLLDVSEQSALQGAYLAAINDWAHQYDGYLKPYDDDKLIFISNRLNLELMIEHKFDLLDKIRQISREHKVRVSISMGMASWDIMYEELGVYAQNAVELAEKRGGDQVVVNIQDQKIAYFGAKSDAAIRNSRVGVRINALTVKDMIDKANDVFIMAHNAADLDAYGSMLAMYHMAKATQKNVKLIINEDQLDHTTTTVYQSVKEKLTHVIADTITSVEAAEHLDDKSLLIVLDTQSPALAMAPELCDTKASIVVIDHHRAGDKGFHASFSIIEPSASSTIELLIDMMSFYNMSDSAMEINDLEASIMYGGLLMDTSDFVYRTTSRTFEVASKLKELGADPSEVKIWLRKDYVRTMEINKLLDRMEIVNKRFAFIVTTEIYDDRALLAQVSEAALQVNGIDASFTIARMDESTVAVSARSWKTVNVQVLMEMIGGGGHFSSAAAQIKQMSINDVYEKLKAYVVLEYGGGEQMKVILVEDVKGKGKKDEIIEVANGFGQFLLNQKKALPATDENIQKLEAEKAEAIAEQKRYINLMKKLKSEIEGKTVTVGIQIGKNGKQFGSITTKQIVEAFQKTHDIVIDKKKLELQSEINSVGIYTAYVTLHKDIKAQFEINVVEK